MIDLNMHFSTMSDPQQKQIAAKKKDIAFKRRLVANLSFFIALINIRKTRACIFGILSKKCKP